MFYRPGIDAHGLSRDPFKACIVPRPIAWVSTRSTEGVANLAPFSFFNAFSWAPPVVALGMPARGSTLEKDTIVNIELMGCFAINMPGRTEAELVNASSFRFPPETDEFALLGVATAECREINAPRVVNASVCLECRYLQTVALPSVRKDEGNALVLGQVVGIHINDHAITNGRIDYARTQPLMRLGYRDWSAVGAVFEMASPTA